MILECKKIKKRSCWLVARRQKQATSQGSRMFLVVRCVKHQSMRPAPGFGLGGIRASVYRVLYVEQSTLPKQYARRTYVAALDDIHIQ